MSSVDVGNYRNLISYTSLVDFVTAGRKISCLQPFFQRSADEWKYADSDKQALGPIVDEYVSCVVTGFTEKTPVEILGTIYFSTYVSKKVDCVGIVDGQQRVVAAIIILKACQVLAEENRFNESFAKDEFGLYLYETVLQTIQNSILQQDQKTPVFVPHKYYLEDWLSAVGTAQSLGSTTFYQDRIIAMANLLKTKLNLVSLSDPADDDLIRRKAAISNLKLLNAFVNYQINSVRYELAKNVGPTGAQTFEHSNEDRAVLHPADALPAVFAAYYEYLEGKNKDELDGKSSYDVSEEIYDRLRDNVFGDTEFDVRKVILKATRSYLESIRVSSVPLSNNEIISEFRFQLSQLETSFERTRWVNSWVRYVNVHKTLQQYDQVIDLDSQCKKRLALLDEPSVDVAAWMFLQAAELDYSNTSVVDKALDLWSSSKVDRGRLSNEVFRKTRLVRFLLHKLISVEVMNEVGVRRQESINFKRALASLHYNGMSAMDYLDVFEDRLLRVWPEGWYQHRSSVENALRSGRPWKAGKRAADFMVDLGWLMGSEEHSYPDSAFDSEHIVANSGPTAVIEEFNKFSTITFNEYKQYKDTIPNLVPLNTSVNGGLSDQCPSKKLPTYVIYSKYLPVVKLAVSCFENNTWTYSSYVKYSKLLAAAMLNSYWTPSIELLNQYDPDDTHLQLAVQLTLRAVPPGRFCTKGALADSIIKSGVFKSRKVTAQRLFVFMDDYRVVRSKKGGGRGLCSAGVDKFTEEQKEQLRSFGVEVYDDNKVKDPVVLTVEDLVKLTPSSSDVFTV